MTSSAAVRLFLDLALIFSLRSWFLSSGVFGYLAGMDLLLISLLMMHIG